MSFLQPNFGGPTATTATAPASTGSESDWTDLDRDYQAELESFGELETEVRHFIARSRADLPAGDYAVVAGNLGETQRRRKQLQGHASLGVLYAIVADDELKQRCLALQADLTDLASEWELERKRHVEAARRRREGHQEDIRRMQGESAAILQESNREVAQVYRDLHERRQESFDLQQQRYIESLTDPSFF